MVAEKPSSSEILYLQVHHCVNFGVTEWQFLWADDAVIECYNICNAQLNLKLQFVSSIHVKTVMFMQAKISENGQYVSPSKY